MAKVAIGDFPVDPSGFSAEGLFRSSDWSGR